MEYEHFLLLTGILHTNQYTGSSESPSISEEILLVYRLGSKDNE
jgi:hypothetical protein